MALSGTADAPLSSLVAASKARAFDSHVTIPHSPVGRNNFALANGSLKWMDFQSIIIQNFVLDDLRPKTRKRCAHCLVAASRLNGAS